jgi:alkanesulfonate monooxygenase SsuD/methylene tetrahydromethanopterin reductase-like flavin-dependent oxidoreductase (luciferase family)
MLLNSAFFEMSKTLFGVRIPNSGPLASPENIRRIGLAAEELGFDAITAHDHVSFGRAERYHFSVGTAESVDENDRLGRPVNLFYETVACFSYLAGMTKRIRFIPAAWVLAWRHPVLLARQACTLYELSGGRVTICVTLGNFKPDFASMQVPWKLKGRIMNEYLDALKHILNDVTTVSFRGDSISISDLDFNPRSKSIPIWVAGTSSKSYQRIAKYAVGWLGGGESPEDYERSLPQLSEELKKCNRSLTEIEVGRQTFLRIGNSFDEAYKEAFHTMAGFYGGKEFEGESDALTRKATKNSFVGTPSDIINVTQRYLNAGVKFHDARLVAGNIDEALRMMTTFSKEVIPSFR